MSTESKTMGINVQNWRYDNVPVVSPFSYQVHEMMRRSISTPDPDALPDGSVRLIIDERRLAEREDEEFLAQLKEYHGRRFSDEW